MRSRSQIPLRKLCEENPAVMYGESEKCTQFVKNFDQRGRNISLGRSFRKRDPLY